MATSYPPRIDTPIMNAEHLFRWSNKYARQSTHGKYIYGVRKVWKNNMWNGSNVQNYATKNATFYGFAICPYDGSEPYHFIEDPCEGNGPVTFGNDILNKLLKNPHSDEPHDGSTRTTHKKEENEEIQKAIPVTNNSTTVRIRDNQITDRQILIDFDFRTDSNGKDPDRNSPSLRKHHRLLWSKKLPNGKMFTLNGRLEHNSDLGDFSLSSDWITHTYSGIGTSDWEGKWKDMKQIISNVPQSDVERFYLLGWTIGGSLVFPGKRKNGETINPARGCDQDVQDRFDVTLDYIRRYYNKENTPPRAKRLWLALNRYSEFFDLFGDFKGYVDFFLLNDLVSEDYSKIDFFIPYDVNKPNPLPKNPKEYVQYMEKSIAFIEKRSMRMKRWAEDNL